MQESSNQINTLFLIFNNATLEIFDINAILH